MIDFHQNSFSADHFSNLHPKDLDCTILNQNACHISDRDLGQFHLLTPLRQNASTTKGVQE